MLFLSTLVLSPSVIQLYSSKQYSYEGQIEKFCNLGFFILTIGCGQLSKVRRLETLFKDSFRFVILTRKTRFLHQIGVGGFQGYKITFERNTSACLMMQITKKTAVRFEIKYFSSYENQQWCQKGCDNVERGRECEASGRGRRKVM